MQTRINPAFHRYPAEAIVVGRLLSAFGELEFTVVEIARRATDNARLPFLRALYRLRASSARLQAADAFMRPVCENFQLGDEYETAKKAVDHCSKIRNQFSHCNWADDPNCSNGGLFFIDLEGAFEDAEDLELHWRPINLELLTSQEAYFIFTLEYLRWINHELAARRGILQPNVWQRPLILEQPRLHNPPSRHIPPWLNEDQKALYLKRATAAEYGVPTPTPKQRSLDKARAEKRAKRQADRDRDAPTGARPDPRR